MKWARIGEVNVSFLMLWVSGLGIAQASPPKPPSACTTWSLLYAIVNRILKLHPLHPLVIEMRSACPAVTAWFTSIDRDLFGFIPPRSNWKPSLGVINPEPTGC